MTVASRPVSLMPLVHYIPRILGDVDATGFNREFSTWADLIVVAIGSLVADKHRRSYVVREVRLKGLQG